MFVGERIDPHGVKQNAESRFIFEQLTVIVLSREPPEPHDAPDVGGNQAVRIMILKETGDLLQLLKGLRPRPDAADRGRHPHLVAANHSGHPLLLRILVLWRALRDGRGSKHLVRGHTFFKHITQRASRQHGKPVRYLGNRFGELLPGRSRLLQFDKRLLEL